MNSCHMNHSTKIIFLFKITLDGSYELDKVTYSYYISYIYLYKYGLQKKRLNSLLNTTIKTVLRTIILI